jgi:hypothetical protein
VTKRRWIPQLLLAGLGALTAAAAVLAVTGASSSSVTPSQLKSELTKPIGLGPHWTLQEPPRIATTRDTWIPSTCYSYATTYGGPSTEATYESNFWGYPYFQEAILIPSAHPNDILDMLASCGNPKGPLPRTLPHGKLTYLRTAPLSAFDGLGDGVFAAVSHPRIDGTVETEIDAYFALGDEIVRISYGGRASLPSLRVAAAYALKRATPHS